MKTSGRFVIVKFNKHEVLPLAASVIKKIIDLSHYELEETTKENGNWTLTLVPVLIFHFCCLPRASKLARQLHVMVKNQLNTLETSNIPN